MLIRAETLPFWVELAIITPFITLKCGVLVFIFLKRKLILKVAVGGGK